MKPYSKRFSVDEIPDLSGKVVIITGGASGIGKEAALQLFQHNAKVYIASRSKTKFDELVKETQDILDDGGNPKVSLNLQFLQLDLSDMKSCVIAAKQFLGMEKRLDVLVANAGLAVVPCTLSKDGIEIQFATNVSPVTMYSLWASLNIFVLASRSFCLHLYLLDIIKKTSIRFGQARIVVVASHAHAMYKPSSSDIIDFKDLKVEGVKELKSFGDVQSLQRYARSKLANILYTRSLATHLRELGYPNIFVNCLNPGTVGTAPSTDSASLPPWLSFVTSSIVRMTSIPPLTGALTTLVLATDLDIASKNLSGRYFDVGPLAGKFWYGYSWDATESKLSEAAKNEELAERLWAWSMEMITSEERGRL